MAIKITHRMHIETQAAPNDCVFTQVYDCPDDMLQDSIGIAQHIEYDMGAVCWIEYLTTPVRG